MTDEIRRFLEEQRRMQELLRPMQQQFEAMNNTYKLFEQNSAHSLFRQEEETRKLLSSFGGHTGLGKAIKDLEAHRKLLESPLLEARRLGVFDAHSDLHKSITTAFEARKAYEAMFRVPQLAEIGQLARQVMEASRLPQTVMQTEEHLRLAMGGMREPWIQIRESISSARAFSDLIAIGRGVNNLPAFDRAFTNELRHSLGDWREQIEIRLEPLLNPLSRSEYYIEMGFDSALTEFTQEAFDQSLEIAGLHEPDISNSVDSDELAQQAYEQLRQFELAIRNFIAEVLQNAFGENWARKQVPSEMLSSWIGKKETAIKNGEEELPLIYYADFTDYKVIIEKRDNWKTVFSSFFQRPEDVRESFQRLYPVRLATMHARIVTRDDVLLMLVETKRVLKAISKK